MATLTKTCTQNVTPGDPISFTVTLTIPEGTTSTIDSIVDFLPIGPSGGQFTITSQSPANFFSIQMIGGIQTVVADGLSFLPVVGPQIYTFTVSANTTLANAGLQITNTATALLDLFGPGVSLQSTATASVAICIHGSSLISLPNNEQIEISKLLPGQLILGADGQSTNIIETVPCWTKNEHCGNCIIFEPNSLETGIPSNRFAVDAGHPICTISNYNVNLEKALTPAKSFVNNKNIYIVNWEDVASLLPGENVRYDIIMKESSCKAYIANGLIIQSRQSRKVTGYSYS